LYWWNRQVATFLLDHARQEEIQKIPVAAPVNPLERLSLVRFSSYKSDAE
jgi:hypothetical protein